MDRLVRNERWPGTGAVAGVAVLGFGGIGAPGWSLGGASNQTGALLGHEEISA